MSSFSSTHVPSTRYTGHLLMLMPLFSIVTVRPLNRTGWPTSYLCDIIARNQFDAGGVCRLEAVELLRHITHIKITQHPFFLVQDEHVGVILHLVLLTKRASELYQFRQFHGLRHTFVGLMKTFRRDAPCRAGSSPGSRHRSATSSSAARQYTL